MAGDRARDESKNKAVNTQLTDEQIKFTGEISVSWNEEYFEGKSHCNFLVKALQVFRALVYHNTLGVRF